MLEVLQELKIDKQELITSVFILETEEIEVWVEPTFIELLSSRDRVQTQVYPGICNRAAEYAALLRIHPY